MRVHKSTIVYVDSGNRKDILKAMIDSDIPDLAIVTEVNNAIEFLPPIIEYGIPQLQYRTVFNFKFEWDDDE